MEKERVVAIISKKWNESLFSVIMISFKIFTKWFQIAVIGKREIKGYTYKEFGNLPIVGVHHMTGYELINNKTGMVLYRRTRDYGIIGNSSSDYDPQAYNTIRNFFPKNVL